jgi:hypothetical protein
MFAFREALSHEGEVLSIHTIRRTSPVLKLGSNIWSCESRGRYEGEERCRGICWENLMERAIWKLYV